MPKKTPLVSSVFWPIKAGSSGGSYPEGERISWGRTRARGRQASAGGSATGKFEKHEVLGVAAPVRCSGDSSLLNPRNTWGDKDAYKKDRVSGRTVDRSG